MFPGFSLSSDAANSRGLAQDDAPECKRCGIVIAKYRANESPPPPPRLGEACRMVWDRWRSLFGTLHLPSILVGFLAGVALTAVGVAFYGSNPLPDPLPEERLVQAVERASAKLQECRDRLWSKLTRGPYPRTERHEAGLEIQVVVCSNYEFGADCAQKVNSLMQEHSESVEKACRTERETLWAAEEAKRLYIVVRRK